jgi:hypothetical protein
MIRLMRGLAIALLLAGCQGPGDDKAATDGQPSEAEVEAGATKDSADPRLNALQRTKRNISDIETKRQNAADSADGTDSQAP